MYLREATQYQPDQFSDIGEGRVTSGVSDVFAADVQHRAQRYSTQCNIITHVEKQAVQVLPQLHGLRSKQEEDKSTSKQRRIAYFKHQFALMLQPIASGKKSILSNDLPDFGVFHSLLPRTGSSPESTCASVVVFRKKNKTRKQRIIQFNLSTNILQ